MKKFIVISTLIFLGLSSFAQKKVQPKKDSIPSVSKEPIDPTQGPPPGATVIILSPDQVHLLEAVIAESNYSFRNTQILLDILRRQQYVVPTPVKDTIIKKMPPTSKADSVVKKS